MIKPKPKKAVKPFPVQVIKAGKIQSKRLPQKVSKKTEFSKTPFNKTEFSYNNKKYRVEHYAEFVPFAVTTRPNATKKKQETLVFFKQKGAAEDLRGTYLVERVAPVGHVEPSGIADYAIIKNRQVLKSAMPEIRIHYYEKSRMAFIEHFDAGIFYKTGVGEILLRQVVKDAKKRGKTMIRTVHNSAYPGVEDFYSRFGFTLQASKYGERYIARISDIEKAMAKINRERVEQERKRRKKA